MKSTAEELKNLSIEIGNQSNENKPIVTAPLNLNSSWEWQSNQLDHPPPQRHSTHHLNF